MRLHVVKRDNCPLWKRLALYVGAVVAALALGAALLLAMGVDPVAYYTRMFTMGMIGNRIAYRTFENYLKVFVPLALTSVALSLAFHVTCRSCWSSLMSICSNFRSLAAVAPGRV